MTAHETQQAQYYWFVSSFEQSTYNPTHPKQNNINTFDLSHLPK